MRNLLRRLLAVTAAAAAVTGALLGVLLASGHAAVVVTHGVSMNPVYYQGDLVAVARADAYHVGDIVAYHVHGGTEIALHRIIGGDANGFTIKGDNNQSTDIDHPAADQIIGRAVLHVPQAGTALKALTSPPVLALAAFALLGGGTTVLTRRQRRRARRRTSMSRHLETGAPSRPLALDQLLQRPLRAWTAGTLVALALSAALGAWAWSGPTEAGAPTSQAVQGRSMDFSYSAPVRPSPAYDGTTVSSPDPVFRKVLAGSVTVAYTYHGPAGTASAAAELSAPGGWHATIPLTGPQPIGDGGTGKAVLDLAALEARAQAAAQATGTTTTPLAVALVPTVHADGTDYAPALKLTLAPLQLSLSDPTGLSTGQKAAGPAAPAAKERSLALGAWSLGAAAARPLSAGALAAAALALAGVALAARRRGPQDEAARVRARWGSLMVPVHPVPAAPGRATVDVDDIATLARLAERYGLLILTWSRSGVETFIVNDENITYRYRTGAAQVPLSEAGAEEGARGGHTR
ncbi:signal peptidase I [Sinomonas atrocyanea]|uniref:signal peptidase I n=1 Tax=Sinomonas atrocyanea TaxID=37927 RepID=UPI002780DEC6|nr:signal peptidase I [Sinomonas atrocyanea]MDQ0259527.1 signal peptidase I [Sinomonas atrocyanea]MDR6623214.1 signal peptidase I [Sinomonas atrocyanea]